MAGRSILFELIVNRCKKDGQTNVSPASFLIEVFKMLDEFNVDSWGVSNEEDIQIVNAELNRIRELTAEKKIATDQMAHVLELKKKEVPESAIDALIVSKIVSTVEFRNMMAGNSDRSVSACDVVENLLQQPTPYILDCIMTTIPDGSQAEPSTDNSSQTEQEEDVVAKHKTPSPLASLFANLPFDDEEEDDKKEDDKEEEDFHALKPTQPQGSKMAEIMNKVEKVRSVLSDTVFGQDHAVSTFVSGYFQSELSATIFDKRDKPRATFLFAGPPGVGKTFLSEQAAKALGLPFKRFDMSEYSDKEANIEFAGSDKVYKNGSEGNVTGFVNENPHCVLLFDEIEKAHLNVIYLFLQILDAGRLRDNYTDEEVSFTDAIIIFTTNAGKRMYEDESINLLTVSKKTIIKALGAEKDPNTGSPLFPAAICSRFATGNVVMFNRMEADFLLKISDKELQKQCKGIADRMGLKVQYDARVPYSILFAEGGKADARTIKAKSIKFINDELYELFRLMKSSSNDCDVAKLKEVNIDLNIAPNSNVLPLFENQEEVNILVLGSKLKNKACQSKLDQVNVFMAETMDELKEVLNTTEVSFALCDVNYKVRKKVKVLNCEDVDSEGMDFFDHLTKFTNIPVYLLQECPSSFSQEELESLSQLGAKGIIDLSWSTQKLNDYIKQVVSNSHLRHSLFELAKSNRIVSYGTSQMVNKQSDKAVISLYDFKLSTAVEAGDNEGVLDDISKPKVRFDDVIGAKDAKAELKYFINYLKDPSKFVKRGIKAPKGILLYGPPGTGKTLLAKAMAGESNVTFIKAEGNQFLKSLVGQGAEAVHQLFANARKYAPAILFIDEIDAIGKNRQGGSPEANHTGDILTSFLTEMDGFNTDQSRPVFVLAATNFGVDKNDPNGLDAALLRRFDRRIYVDLPDRDERKQFINMRLGKIKNNAVTAEQVDNLALRSTGSSLAELDNVIELALRNVFKTEDGLLTDAILEDAFETFTSGEVKKWAEDELLRTARHEAGHALLCWASGEKPSYLTIVARGDHGGYMQHGDTEKKGLYTKKDLIAKVRTSLAGRAAEIVYYGEEDGLSSGPSGDLQSATSIMKAMICTYGMDEKMGLCAMNMAEISSTPYYAQIVARINERLNEEFMATKSVVENNKNAIDALVDALMTKNSLKGDEIARILSANFKG